VPARLPPLQIHPAGDSALLIRLGEQIDLDVNGQVHRLARALAAHPFPGIGAAVSGYAALLINYDPLELSYAQAVAWIEQCSFQAGEATETPHRVEIPVRYGGEYGPDLAFVAAHNHMTEAEVIQRHTAHEYLVFLMGFTPGFPYLGGMDSAIAAPRLETPRSLIPAGSVGIAGEQTGVYPIDSPGGWRIIGRTPLRLFDLTREPPFLVAPGDSIVFRVMDDSGAAHGT
jgi:KipI family sensor histidine kinase inhibitor